MFDANYYMEKLRKGKGVTIACSRYEKYIWCSDGKFRSVMEDGLNELVSRGLSENQVRDSISYALSNPSDYDCYVEL